MKGKNVSSVSASASGYRQLGTKQRTASAEKRPPVPAVTFQVKHPDYSSVLLKVRLT